MSCSRAGTRKRARPLLGTFVEISLSAQAGEGLLDDCFASAFAAVVEVERRMSRYRDGSDLSRLNAAAPGEWVEVDGSLAEVLAVANRLFHESCGTFDVRCGDGPLGDLPPGLPPVEIDGLGVRRTSRSRLDLGGIAKGYAVDLASETIRQRLSGVETSGVVNAGGDLRVWGEEEKTVGVRVVGEDGERLHPLLVREVAVATSTVGSSRTGRAPRHPEHVRMPVGVPLRDAMTVTAIAEGCLFADALTKVVTLAPVEISRRCLAAHDAQALVFDAAGELRQVLP